MSGTSVLVAGIGNIFFGDDAFGSEVARRLAGRPVPAGVRVVDFGIRGLDLAFALLDGPRVTILVDSIRRGGAAGTLYLIEPDQGTPHPLEGWDAPDGHGMDPARVLRLVREMGGQDRRVLLVGCEPATVEEDAEGRVGLSAPVEAAVEGAIRMIESLLAEFTREEVPPCTNCPS